MPERIHQGPFLTRLEAARLAGVSTRQIVERPDLLRLGGTHLEEVYHAFQFDRSGVREDLASVVRDLKRRFDDVAIADWLVRPNPSLGGVTPLRTIDTTGRADLLTKASYDDPPVPDPEPNTRASPGYGDS